MQPDLLPAQAFGPKSREACLGNGPVDPSCSADVVLSLLESWGIERVSAKRKLDHSSRQKLQLTAFILLLSAAPVAFVEEMMEESQACLVSTRDQARSLGDGFFVRGDYQHAGECYETAEEYELANRAYLKALVPGGKATAGKLSEQREQATTLWEKVHRALQHDH